MNYMHNLLVYFRLEMGIFLFEKNFFSNLRIFSCFHLFSSIFSLECEQVMYASSKLIENLMNLKVNSLFKKLFKKKLKK